MGQFIFKLPDLGEGTVEAEVIQWHVKPGDLVGEDDALVDMMTDKASVEVPSPVAGKVLEVSGAPGDKVAVGSQLALIETDADTTEAPAPAAAKAPAAEPAKKAALKQDAKARPAKPEPVAEKLAPAPSAEVEAPAAAPSAEVKAPVAAATEGKVLTSPSIRRRAREAGIDLSRVPGSGPHGRILPEDFNAFVNGTAAGAPAAPQTRHGTEEIKVIGLRRLIAERMSASKRTIPHFAYVEEVDVTELEALRVHLNRNAEQPLSYLPFIAAALIKVLRDFPQCNALHDADRGVIVRHHPVHLGVATQSPDGLKVPVVRHAEAYGLWDLADQIRRVSEAARDGSATREELTGSTITITSLGKLGGIVSTPVINAPEVAIIGVNRAAERPMVVGGAVAIRRMMNLSSSFDHRFVDGYDAAAMIQALKEHLEHPATIFIPG